LIMREKLLPALAPLLFTLSLLGAMAYLVLLPDQPRPGEIALKAVMAGSLAVLAALEARCRDGWLLAAALGLGMVGDIVIALPGGFGGGLAAFLLGHLCYAALFWRQRSGRWAWAAAVLVLALSGALLVQVLPGTGSMTAPVLLYMLVISAMAVLAWSSRAAPLAGFGALLFIISDSLIALDAFARPASQAWGVVPAVIWVTYVGAQILLFLGARRAIAPLQARAEPAI
jgi:uncharacterized membrane protein YhhN